MPSYQQNYPHVEGIGGVWDSSYGDLQYLGPSWRPEAVSLAHSGAMCHVQYDNAFQVDAYIPFNKFAGDLSFHLVDASSLGSLYPYQVCHPCPCWPFDSHTSNSPNSR